MINLHYIRAAIEENTGFRLSLRRVRELLVEEGLITQEQANEEAKLFTGYEELFELERSLEAEIDLDQEMGLPDEPIPGS